MDGGRSPGDRNSARRWLSLAVVGVAALVTPASSADEAHTASGLEAPPLSVVAKPAGPKFFVLGVWVQPGEMMAGWRARGVNTLVEIPQQHDPAEWIRAADAAGLYQIRHPAASLAADLKDPHLLAWATQDEPSDTHDGVLATGHVRQSPEEVAQEAAPWRAAARAAGTYVPIWTNHVGGHIYPNWAADNALMHRYMAGPESDWLAGDAYPSERGEPFVIRASDGYASTAQAIVVDRQRAWSGGKPVMAFIGTSAFSAGAPAPSAAQVRVIAWSLVIHGAAGVIYFPVQFKPQWSFDATPPNVADALSRFDGEIAKIDDVLMDPVRGGRRRFTLFRAANPGASPAAGQLPYPFEAAEIPTPHGPYRIIANLSAERQAFDRPAWGLSNQVFGPYEVRIGVGGDLRAAS